MHFYVLAVQWILGQKISADKTYIGTEVLRLSLARLAKKPDFCVFPFFPYKICQYALLENGLLLKLFRPHSRCQSKSKIWVN